MTSNDSRHPSQYVAPLRVVPDPIPKSSVELGWKDLGYWAAITSLYIGAVIITVKLAQAHARFIQRHRKGQ